MLNWCCRYFQYQETGFYYLQTRYYDPTICRFINADTFATTDIDGLLSTNMFSYCENNPVMGVDYNGDIVDTIWDVVSLGMSIAEVVANPYDPMAWVGLVGDAVDLIPCISGVGEIVRSINTAHKAGKKADAVKIANQALDRIKAAATKLPKGNNTVYISKNADGLIDYVGITNNFERRKAEWSRAGREINRYVSDLDRTSARYVEQAVIDTFGTGKKGGILTNKNNSISAKSPKYQGFLDFFKSIF